MTEERMSKKEFVRTLADCTRDTTDRLMKEMSAAYPDWLDYVAVGKITSLLIALNDDVEALYDIMAYYFERNTGQAWCEEEEEERI